jgi:beta-N-acetylhexosaminidase
MTGSARGGRDGRNTSCSSQHLLLQQLIMPIGELFILGFFGRVVPPWLREFAARHGLGGVILFDYSCRTGKYDNNIESPEQLRGLCAAISALPSGPMVFIDQEGGLVRRLKEDRGFRPPPSAREFNLLAPDVKRTLLAASLDELRALGIHYNFAPAIDVDYNPANPNIGKIKRSYSVDIHEVEANALLAGEAARDAGVGLCLKHFPGIGGADVDSHQDFMDLAEVLVPEQEALFYSLAPKIFGDAVLVSHAIVRQWDSENPATLSQAAIGRLRAHLPDTLLISDDMQMQGLQKAFGTREASVRSVKAGIDMLCIGNNLLDQEQEMSGIADELAQRMRIERSLRWRSRNRSRGCAAERRFWAPDGQITEWAIATLAARWQQHGPPSGASRRKNGE